MLGLRVEVQRQVTDVLATIGEKRDLLIGLHALGGEDLEQAPFRFGVVGLHVSEALGRPLVGDDLPGDHLEPAVPPGGLRTGMHVAAVQADDQRQIRARQFLPVSLAGVDEGELLGTQLVLQALSYGLNVVAHSGGVQGTAQGKDLAQQLGGQPIGDQSGELGFQVLKLRCDPSGEHRGQRAERPADLGLAATVPPPRTGQPQGPEQAAHHDGAGGEREKPWEATRPGLVNRVCW